MKALFKTIKQAVYEFIDDDCMSSGAAIAYYSIFALPPLLVIVFLIASYAGVSPEQINDVAREQFGAPTSALGVQHQRAPSTQANSEPDQANEAKREGSGKSQADEAAQPKDSQLQNIAMRATPGEIGGLGIAGRIIGVGVLIFTATGLFAQLQSALNRVWEVTPDPSRGGVKTFLWKRLLSLGMILVMAFLLLVSLVVSALIHQILALIQGATPSTALWIVTILLENTATFVIGTLLFAAMFKVLPDAEMAWRDMWLGAAMTAGLFVLGKAIVSAYLQQAELGASWGDAAGSIIAILAWLYYSSLIVLFGAELTQVWAKRFGHGVRPEEGAVRAVHEERLERK